MPTISVIVPVYKVEPYLRRCVDSILAQTFQDFELILVDDGSPDCCGAICDEYAEKDSRIRVIHKKNGGVSSARNAGLDVCRGEYVSFCDSDDYIGANWLSELAAAAEKTEADLIMANLTVQSSDNERSPFRVNSENDISIRDANGKIEFIIDALLKRNIDCAVWSKLFRQSIIRNHNVRFSETCGNYAEDLGFVMEYVLYCSSIRQIDIAEYFYVQHGSSMMANSKAVFRLDSMNEVSKALGQRLASEFGSKSARRVMPVLHYMIMDHEYEKLVVSESFKSLKNELKTIGDRRWFRSNTRRAFASYGYAKRVLGMPRAQRMLLMSSYCLHGSWRLHKLISGAFYKLFYSER